MESHSRRNRANEAGSTYSGAWARRRLIRDHVDLAALPYVVPESDIIDTKHGLLSLPRALLSDGATGFLVRDFEPKTFFPHDRLYICPTVADRDSGDIVRLNKIQCDLIYGALLLRHWHLCAAAIRPIGLIGIPKSWLIWRECRAKERANPQWWTLPLEEGGRFVPYRDGWHFPSWRTEHAVWDPPEGIILP